MRPFRIWSPCIPVSAALAVIMAISPARLGAQDAAAEPAQPPATVEEPAVPPTAEPAPVVEAAVDTTAAEAVPSVALASDSAVTAVDTTAAAPVAAVDSAAVDTAAAVVEPAPVVTKPKRYSDRTNAFTLAGAASVAALVIGLSW